MTTVEYSVLINGEAKGKINPTRGLRQGDPISPYLFLLYTEGLSAMLKKEERAGKIKGVAACRGLRVYPTCSLRMIALCFVKHQWRNVIGLSKFWRSMKVIRGRN